jgi:hypothetical protein
MEEDFLIVLPEIETRKTASFAESRVTMYTKIVVHYNNGTEGTIDSPRLEEAIASGMINRFLRSDGWIDAEGAKTRGMSWETWTGYERRRDYLARQASFQAMKAHEDTPYDASLFNRISQYWLQNWTIKQWTRMMR